MKMFIVWLMVLVMCSPAFAAPAQVPLEIARDVVGSDRTLTPKASKWVDHVVLVAGVAQTYTVPSWGKFVRIVGAGANVLANFSGGAAAIPVANVVDGTGSAVNPGTRQVTGGSTISLIAPIGCVVSVEVWR